MQEGNNFPAAAQCVRARSDEIKLLRMLPSRKCFGSSSVWPDGKTIFPIFVHVVQRKFAQLRKNCQSWLIFDQLLNNPAQRMPIFLNFAKGANFNISGHAVRLRPS